MQLESLRKVCAQATELESAQLHRFVAMQQMLQREQQQGQQLLQHQQVYMQQTPVVGQQVTAQLLQQHTHFLRKLRQAIAQQDARIQHFSLQCQQQHECWQQAHTRVESLKFLIEREEQRLDAIEIKQEQALLDEFNQRSKWNRSAVKIG